MAPFRQRTIYEVNADLSFYQLNEEGPCGGRSTPKRAGHERRSLLEAKDSRCAADHRRRGPGGDQIPLLDVAAILWTAQKDLRQSRRSHPQ